MNEEYARSSDVDGFTVVERVGRSPVVHLLRPWPECNVELGAAITRVPGSREHLAGVLRGKTAKSCLRCFPASSEDDRLEEEIAYADEEAVELLRR